MSRLVIFSCLFLATFAVPYNKQTEQRIVGGRDTDITAVPHQVSLRYDGRLKCGGSIIGPRHVLTAAHCVEDKEPARFTVRAGSNKYYRGGQKVGVARIISHPRYDKDTVDYDVAVLVLKEPLRFSSTVQPATLASVEPKDGDMVLISGWGSMQKDKGMSENLQSVEVPVMSKKLCIQKYDDDEDITDRMFCAGFTTGGKDSCEGDSGGPAMVKGKLAGIVSWGEGCGDPKYPGVYTNIAKIGSWILAQTRA